ncbi:MAG: Ig-like domain-containing protein, partial [Dehalococcoidia bacterium]
DLGGLIPKTTYHFRAKAIGDGVDSGEDKTFKTSDVPPAVITNPATRIKPDSAVLNGRLDNPGTAASVSVSFEWGLTAAYGNSTPAQPMAKRGDFEALISGLAPSQTYHFRAKAVGDGTIFGADRTFTTDTILTGITVTPNPATIDVGNTQQFAARGAYSDGRTNVDITGVKWSSSNPAVASINNNGQAKGQSIGNVIITATLDGIPGTATLTVNPAAVTGIAVNPRNASVDVGATTRFRATATYSDNTKKDVTDTAAWTSSAPTKASVNAGTATGLIADGTAITITASLNGFSDTATLKVVATEAILQSIDVTPNNPAAISAGETLQLTAMGTYKNPDGSTSTADVTRKASWNSSDTAISRVSGNGLARSYAQGSAVITAAIDNISGSETLTVNAPALASITVTPERPILTYVSGGTTTQQFAATGVYTDNSTQDLTGTVTWDRLTPATAAINNTGLATAAAVAARSTTRITATQGGKTGETILTVLPDKVAPVVTLTSPTDGLVLKDKTLTVSGITSDPNAATVVIVNGGTAVALTVAGDGSFSQGVSLKAGNNSILVKSTDGANNTGKAGPINVIVDARRPTVTIMEPADGFLTNTASIIVNGLVSGASSVTLNINGASVPVTVSGGRFSKTVSILEGTNKITASAYADGHPNDPDYLGTSGTRTATLDTKAPIVTIISPISGISVGTAGIEVTGSIDDPTISTALLILNGGVPRMIEVADGKFSQKITLRSGSNTIVVAATDSVGNSGSSGAPVVVTFDNTRPSVTITEPVNRLLTNIAAQTVTGTVDDQTITSATLRLNGTDYQVDVAPDGTFSKGITLAAGINTLKASATDSAGNSGTSGEITVNLDVASPVLTIGLSDPTESIVIVVESDESLNATPTVSVSGTDIPMSR